MRYDTTSLAIVVGIALVVGGLQVWMTLGAERRIRRWAEDNGLTILKIRQAMFRRGPFGLFAGTTAARADFVYRLTVRDAKGQDLEVWARVAWWYALGHRGSSVDARWVDQTPDLRPRPQQ